MDVELRGLRVGVQGLRLGSYRLERARHDARFRKHGG